MATSDAEMHSFESLMEWEADDPWDNIILTRIKQIIRNHLPRGWNEWKIRIFKKEELLDSEFDPQILNKIRFAIPTVDLARAFSPNSTSLKEKSYRDIKLKLLEWPLGIGLIVHPMSLAARVHGSAVQNELLLASIAEMKPLLKSRKEADKELSGQVGHSDDEMSIPSTITTSGRTMKPSRLDKLEQRQFKLVKMMEQFIKNFQPETQSCFASENEYTSQESPEDEQNIPQPRPLSPKPWEPPIPIADDDFDWTPATKLQEPLIPAAKPHIATHAECQRRGDSTFNQIRYAEVQKNLHASPVFGPLKVNPILTEYGTSPNQDYLVRMDYTLCTISHGLLLQRESLANMLKDLANKHPSMKHDLKNILSTDSTFKSLSDDLLQYVFDRRAEIIEQRRNGFLPKEKYQAGLLGAIFPSTTHQFCETGLAELHRQPSQQTFFRNPHRKPLQAKNYNSTYSARQARPTHKVSKTSKPYNRQRKSGTGKNARKF